MDDVCIGGYSDGLTMIRIMLLFVLDDLWLMGRDVVPEHC